MDAYDDMTMPSADQAVANGKALFNELCPECGAPMDYVCRPDGTDGGPYCFACHSRRFWNELRYPRWVHLTHFVGWCGLCAGDVREIDLGDRYMGYRHMCERCGHLHHNPPDTVVVNIERARNRLEFVDHMIAKNKAAKQRKKAAR